MVVLYHFTSHLLFSSGSMTVSCLTMGFCCHFVSLCSFCLLCATSHLIYFSYVYNFEPLSASWASFPWLFGRLSLCPLGPLSNFSIVVSGKLDGCTREARVCVVFYFENHIFRFAVINALTHFLERKEYFVFAVGAGDTRKKGEVEGHWTGLAPAGKRRGSNRAGGDDWDCDAAWDWAWRESG